jgi:hypothetical protein
VSYKPAYADSYALIIGINKYKLVSPLNCARNDAEAVAEVLINRMGFPKRNVTLLLDGKATAQGIRSAFLNYAVSESAHPDDRLFVFFAGHGFTFAAGRRGEAGFLVPVDGDTSDLSTLIRWDDLVGSADLIPAKHILFLVDACYGGLALSRRPLPPGSTRFLRDMLQRFARQVLTSGKADEVVADAGGVRAGHSIFTAHVLDALEGAAATSDGVLTANRLMAYVYEKVASDQHSHQTPHYGFLDGDGDFVFDTTPLEKLDIEETKGKDLLVNVGTATPILSVFSDSISDSLKQLISDPREQIRLDDFVSSHLRRAIQLLDLQNFPASESITDETFKGVFAGRLKQYEEATADLRTIVILLARWATPNQIPLLTKIFARLGLHPVWLTPA